MSFEFKLTLFLIFAAVCALLGGWSALLDSSTVVAWIRQGGYWMVLVTFILWIVALVGAYPGALKRDGWSWLWGKKHRWGILLILGLFALTQLQEEKGFKILLDEPVLMNTSRMMHFNREVMVVSNAHRVDGVLAAKGYVDKRPNFFPFLLSVTHDLTGYRVENAFYLNAVLLLVLLGLTYTVGNMLGGPWAGMVSVAMVGSVPLLWHQAAGGGFEILNLVMLAFTMKLAIDYLQRPDEKRLGALCLTAVMLAQVRYESVLFLLPVAMVGLLGWKAAGRGMLPWGAWVAVVGLVPVLWQMRVFEIDSGFWELFTVGLEKPFSLEYFNSNLMQAGAFFFEWIKQQPAAPLVAWLGVGAVFMGLAAHHIRLVSYWMWVGVWTIFTATYLFVGGVGGLDYVTFGVLMAVAVGLNFVKFNRGYAKELLEEERPQLVYVIFLLGYALYFVLLMCYAFDMGRYMVARLSLPLYLIMGISAGCVFARFAAEKWGRCAMGGLSGMALAGGLVALLAPVAGGVLTAMEEAGSSEAVVALLSVGFVLAGLVGLTGAAVGGVWLGGLCKEGIWKKSLGAFLALGFVGWTLPSASSRDYAALYFPREEAKQVATFIKEKKAAGERFLAIADMSMLWTAYDVEALPNRAVNNQLAQVKYFLEQPNNIPIYVVQSLQYDPLSHHLADVGSEPLTDRAVIRPVWQRHISTFRLLRISRLVDLEGIAPVDDSKLFQENDAETLRDWVEIMP